MPRPIQEIRRDIAVNKASGGQVRAGALRELEAELRAATRPVRATFCPKCRTSGTPGARCKCAPRSAAGDGIPFYNLTPDGQATRSKPAPSARPARSIAETRARWNQIMDHDALEDGFRLVSLPYREVRDQALRTIESRSSELSPASQDRLEALVRTRTVATDGRLIAQRIAATGSRAYESAYDKAMTSKHPGWAPEEVRAVNTFREVQASEQRAASEGTGSAGGFGVPFYVDPTLIVTTLDQAEIGLVANIVTITTNKWHGVSTPGVSSGFTAEGSAVADGTPTLAQPEIDVWADKFYVPASLELTMDYPGWLDEITRLFMAQWANDVSEYTSIGTGVAQPKGAFVSMSNQTTSPAHVTVTTAGQLGAIDLRKAWSALPERYRLNASWLMSPSMVQQVSTQAAATVTNGLGSSEWTFADSGQPRLFGRPVVQSSYAPSFTGTTAAANYVVVGDFSRFYIVHRSGLDVELVTGIPNFPASNLPTGSVGVFGVSRFGSDVVDTNAFRILSNS